MDIQLAAQLAQERGAKLAQVPKGDSVPLTQETVDGSKRDQKKPIYNEPNIGDRIDVYWNRDDKWYSGTVTHFTPDGIDVDEKTFREHVPSAPVPRKTLVNVYYYCKKSIQDPTKAHQRRTMGSEWFHSKNKIGKFKQS